jgi:hypothetical protein
VPVASIRRGALWHTRFRLHRRHLCTDCLVIISDVLETELEINLRDPDE